MPGANLRAEEHECRLRPVPPGELAPSSEARRSTGWGKRHGCAGKVPVLIWGDLHVMRAGNATGVGLRPGAKGPEAPPNPTANRSARRSATAVVSVQKSAEAIVPEPAAVACDGKGRTSLVKEEP